MKCSQATTFSVGTAAIREIDRVCNRKVLEGLTPAQRELNLQEMKESMNCIRGEINETSPAKTSI